MLVEAFPHPKCALDFTSPLQLLIATVLSAQTTDKRVNTVTPELFSRFPDAASLAAANPQDVEDIIHPLGFYRSKTKHLLGLAVVLRDRFGGEVPDTMDSLVTLPGVGRKTANVVMNVAFGEPAIAVDTHIFRVCNRTGFAPGKNPTEVEEKLLKVVPKDYLLNAHHWLLLFGRYICKARNPECVRCPVAEYCSAPEKTEALAKAAEEAADLKPGSPAKKPRAKKKPTLPEVKSNDRSV